MPDGDQTATPTLLQELREEQTIVREGYRFLDEKRLLLAAEVIRQLERYRDLHDEYLQLHERAALAMEAATARHGIEELQVYPPAADLEEAQVVTERRTFLGVVLLKGALEYEAVPPPVAIDPSPEARACRRLFRDMVDRGAELAAITGNLERLLEEYRKTERRARALEDVLLPEVDSRLREVAVRLEELDQEEAIRSRLGRR